MLRQASLYGDTLGFRLGCEQVYLLSDPEDVRQLLVNEAALCQKGDYVRRSRWLLGDGLITAEGETHARLKRLVQPAFQRNRMAQYAEQMAECAGEFAGQWRAGQSVEVVSQLTRATLHIICRVLFATRSEAEAGAIGDSIGGSLKYFPYWLLPFSRILDFLPVSPGRLFQGTRRRVDELFYRMIDSRPQQGVLSVLQQGPLSQSELRDQCLTLFMAGHEATANLLAWTFYALGRDQRAQARVREEVTQREPTRYEEFPFTRAVLLETLRLYPPVWRLSRKILADIRFKDHLLPAGSTVLVSPYVIQRDPRHFERPLEFWPERWLRPEKPPRFAFFPFGGGPRACLGEAFTMMEGTILLAVLARRYAWILQDAQRAPQALPVVTLRPRDGIRVKLSAGGL